MKIFVAEDDELVSVLLRDFLSDLGHEVSVAQNGEDLVKLTLVERPDLIVTDLHMPKMTGNSMIAMIDMYPPLSGIPVIMVSGATKQDLADAGIPKEIPIIPKPVDFDRLSLEVKKVADKLSGAGG